ncbi:MAG: hypothetical protein GY790_13730 [Bacteroidetes bacterium]|nr:hypothetical protein [Bacteroidota bacterium]
MKKRGLTAVILVIVLVIITVIVVDFLNNRPDRRGSNPYALEVEHLKKVDPELISHRETKILSLGSLEGSAVVYAEGKLFVVGDSSLVKMLPDGSAVEQFPVDPHPLSLLVEEQEIYVAYKNYVAQYDRDMKLVKRWDSMGDRAVVTNLAGNGEQVYVADAGNRQVIIYSRDGEVQGVIEGKAETDAGHGFIVPSANFDLVVNSFGELWVVNPGKHALENYSDDGRMRGFWENASFDINGFTGCCNPARITALDDGSFVTSEKGLVRIKIHDQSGQLKSVVAAPDLFKEEGKAPDVCADESGVVYALDFDRNVIRIFEPKTDE